MRLRWTDEALADVDRVFDFLAANNPPAAERAVRKLLTFPSVLTANPSMGAVVEKLADQQIRRMIIGAYELRYQVTGDVVEILRIFHTREDR